MATSSQLPKLLAYSAVSAHGLPPVRIEFMAAFMAPLQWGAVLTGGVTLFSS